MIPLNDFVLIRDNRNEMRLLRICDKKNFKWRKTPINLTQLAQYPFYTTLQVGNHELHLAPQASLQEPDSFEGEGNKEIYTLDDAQKLQQQTIVEMKGRMRPEEMIEEIVAHNQQFEKRTTYSKQKYIRDKKKKYCFHIHAQPVSLANVHQEYFQNSSSSIYHIRWDILALLLLRAGPYGKVLLGEQSKGLILGAICQRNPTHIYCVNKNKQSLKQFSIVNQLNLRPQNIEFITWTEVQAYNDFDNLILVGDYDFVALARKCTPLLRKGAILAFLCLSSELLIQAFKQLTQLKYIHIQLSDTFTREYQVLKNRTHPLVSMHARSGYLLTAIRV